MYCSRELVITSFSSVFSMGPQEARKYVNSYRDALQGDPDNTMLNSGIALCYLNLGLYDKAIEAFERAIDDNLDNPETYFYAAVALLKGKRPFACSMAQIRQAEQLLNAAVSIEPRGLFYYLHAFLKYDYFERKCLNASPDYRELLAKAHYNGFSSTDIAMLEESLGVSVDF